MTSQPEFLSTTEAAKLLDVHLNTIKNWIKEGRLPYSKIGMTYRIPKEAIANNIKKIALGTRVIAVANQKGGVAKTTTTLNVATGLGKYSKRVLVVDLDPQGGCAVSLGIQTDNLNETVYTALMRDEVGFKDIIRRTPYGFDLAPSNIDLAGAEIELKQLLASEQVLKRKLAMAMDDYDFILLDCPPSLGMLTINAFTAASELLIPMSMEYLALRGLDMLAKTVTKVRAITNPNLSYLGILATKYDRRTVNSREILDALKRTAKQAGINVFNTYVVNSVRFAESPNSKKPLLVDDPEHEGSKAYLQVVSEILNE